MSPFIVTINFILSLLTVIGDIFILASIILLLIVIIRKINMRKNKIFVFIAKNAILFAWIISIIAMSGSLFYSEVAGYEPCKLCWFQRICMYPFVLLFGISLLKKDNKIVDYALGLSGVGAVIAVYHYYLQLGGSSFFPCSAVGYSVSCSQRFVLEFGYITIPMMALTGFLMIIVLMIIKKIQETKKII